MQFSDFSLGRLKRTDRMTILLIDSLCWGLNDRLHFKAVGQRCLGRLGRLYVVLRIAVSASQRPNLVDAFVGE